MKNNQEQIIKMFDAISSSYDLTNRVLSLGIDVSWRKEACRKALELQKGNDLVIADIACGTGDMILHWQDFTKDKKVKFIGIDPSSGMLEIAKDKLKDLLLLEKLQLFLAQAQELKILKNQSIDILSIAYGIRNVVDIDQALVEFARVLKKDGVLVILEFTKNESKGILDRLAQFYTKRILPIIGGLVSRNYKAYKYLPDSIQDFLSTDVLVEKLCKNGFRMHIIKSYSANISTLIIAIKE